VIFLEIDIYMG